MPVLTAPPTAPSTTDPATFQARADALVAWLSTHVSEISAFQAALTALAGGTAFAIPYTVDSATADADPGPGKLRFDNFAAQTSAATLRLDLLDAAGATQTTIIDSFDDSTSTVKGQFKLVKLADPAVWLSGNLTAVASPAGYRNVTISGVTGSSAAPFVNPDSVILLFTRSGDKGDPGAAGTLSQTVVERTSNTIITNADKGKLIKASGTWTQTFAAAATFDADFFIDYENTSTGDITHDPDGAELIDGRTTYAQYGAEIRRIRKTQAGTGLESSILKPFYKAWTATAASQPIPPGYRYFGGLLWGGGGAGANLSGGKPSGGGGGACVPFNLPAASFGTTENITIGATAAGVVTSNLGTNGNNSSLGSLVTAYGGGGGGNSAASPGGAGGGALSGGAATTTSPSVGGGPAGSSGSSNAGFGGAGGATAAAGGDSAYGGASGGGGNGTFAGGNSLYGGAGGGASNTSVSAAGGTSRFGGAGGAGGAGGNGTDGTAPGGGGGAASAAASTSGAGARGELRMWGVV